MESNSLGRKNKILLIGLLSSSLLLLQGCGSGRKGITIDSDPQGADIVADGKNIGQTPMQIKQDDVFPPRWHGSSYMVKGDLAIHKEGCDDIKMKVNDSVLSKDIKASLKCRPGATKPMPVAAPVSSKSVADKASAPASTPVTAPVKIETQAPVKSSATGDEIEKRLAKLKYLRDRGVITSKEYADQRKRILDSL